MAYAIGYLLPIIGIGALIFWIGSNMAREAELNAYIREHNRKIEERHSER